ncbi:MAG: TrmB family transcriptional regulator [Sulfobacillus acidophilus]|uniref:TrmB family transcriptional regulator n=1 Tax=Sulfobacillus acidophilus TaxID=53633 RepID=A0A2T2WDM1_9FIRM|nr:MAG: TrmB family transcriptional regulator [Sulfobacillus acidophilus]
MDLVQALQEVGWSELEARVYVALAATDEALTGYQVAKIARSARANVYPVLEKLVRRGALVEEPQDQGPRYRPVPFSDIAQSQLSSMKKTLGAIAAMLPTSARPQTLVTARGDKAVWTHGLKLLTSTHRTLDVGASHGTVKPFAEGLAEARERGVRERFLCFDRCPPPGCGVCQHPIPVSTGKFNPTGWLVLLRDNEETLIAMGEGDDSELVLTNMAPIRETLNMLFRTGDAAVVAQPAR